MAEAIAIYIGLLLALETGFTNVVNECNAQVIVNWIKNDSRLYSEVGLILADIKILFYNFGSVEVSYVPRKANQVANCLAKMALSSSID